jgi:ABC-type Fe3+-hydroxamate transport system substrate-binding protein
MSLRSNTIIDARGRPFSALARPARVVSLVPSITELLFDLGLNQEEIVGRTKFCIHPLEGVRRIPSVGGTKTVHVDKVLDLKPDIVIANIDENELEVVENIESGESPVPVFVTHPLNIRDARCMIRELGTLFGASANASALDERIQRSIAAISGARNGRVLYLIWHKPYMTVAPGTYIDSMLGLIGFSNVIDNTWLQGRSFASTGARRYPVLTAADIAELAPEIVLFSSEPFPFKQRHIDAFLAEQRKHGILAPQCSIVDGELYSWYGTRILNVGKLQLG